MRKKQTTDLPSYLLLTGGRFVLSKTNAFDSISIHPATFPFSLVLVFTAVAFTP